MYKGNDTCLEKSRDDEPIFVLVARDALAPEIVCQWILTAIRERVDSNKIADAARCLAAMLEYQGENGSRKPD